MSKIRMNQPVRWSDGTIATPQEMLSSGRAEIRNVPRFMGPRGSIRSAVFVDLKGTTCGVEVSGYVQAAIAGEGGK